MNFYSTYGEALRCQICEDSTYHTVDLGNGLFITYNLPSPYCVRHKSIRCKPYHEICITQAMKTHESGWMLIKGCDFRSRYNHMNFCETVPASVTSIKEENEFQKIILRKTEQAVICTCDTSDCNLATKFQISFQFFLFFTVFAVFSLQFF